MATHHDFKVKNGLNANGELLDSAWVQSRQITYNTSNFVDSSYVTTQINNLISGADAAFDTLKEIQDAMATDSELSVAISNLTIPSLGNDYVDSAYVSSQINNITIPSLGNDYVDSAYVSSQINNITIPSLGNDYVDSAYVSSQLTPANISDVANTATEFFDLPSGTTAQRPSNPTSGNIRFNETLSLAEYYDGAQWKIIDIPPTISSINPTIIPDTDSSVNITITGSNFQSGAVVQAIGKSGTIIGATTTTVNSSTQIVANFNGTLFTDAEENYSIKVSNSSGLSFTFTESLAVNASPVWTTPASPTTFATIFAEDVYDSQGNSIQVVATDDEGAILEYSLTSGTLPSALSLDSDGYITGTVAIGTYASGGETYTPTISVTDGTNTVNRTFAIVKKWYDGSTSALAAPSAKHIIDTTGITTNGYYYIKPAGYSGSAQQVFCDMSNDGGGWMLMSATGVDVFYLHVRDDSYNLPFNADAIAVNAGGKTTSGYAGNLGQSFIDQMVVANRQSSIARFNIHDGGATWRSYFFPTDANARWYDIVNRSSTNDNATSCDLTRRNLSGNTWLKSGYYTYTADTGNGGAGSVSGTPVTQGASCWGTFPYNMDTNDVYGENWGYSIAPNYNATFANPNTQYASCHSNGWNRAGNFWFKAG